MEHDVSEGVVSYPRFWSSYLSHNGVRRCGVRTTEGYQVTPPIEYVSDRTVVGVHVRDLSCDVVPVVMVTLSVIGIEGVIDADARRFPTTRCIDYYFFTARCYAERGIAKASCLSVRPFVRL